MCRARANIGEQCVVAMFHPGGQRMAGDQLKHDRPNHGRTCPQNRQFDLDTAHVSHAYGSSDPP